MIRTDHKLRGEFLLISLLLFFVALPFLENNTTGEFILVLTQYLTLVAATVQLAAQRKVFKAAIPLGGLSMLLLMASHFHPVQPLLIANSLALMLFLGLVCISLFNYLGQTGRIDNGRIYASVSLYLLLGMFWYCLYSLINHVQPGSFASSGATIQGKAFPSTLLYFSLATLTTLGYGDVVAVGAVPRMFATLEAVAGVLYIAITVARLVSAYQRTHGEG